MASQSPTPRSPDRNVKSPNAVSAPKKRNHPFIISSLFDILENVGPEPANLYGLRHSHTTIVTRDENGESVEWVVKCVAYGGTDIVLDVDGVYYLKGRLLALNQKDTQKFFYEPDYQLLANTSETLPCNLSNGVSVTGLGIIDSRTVEPVETGKVNVFLIVRHSDYNPEIQAQSVFEVEYRSMWSKLMEKLQPLMVVGREVMLTGHIVGRNEIKNRWIVQMTGVSVTSGSEPSSAPAPNEGSSTRTTPRGRNRAKIVFTDQHEVVPGPSSTSSNVKDGTDVLSLEAGGLDTAQEESPGGKSKGKAAGRAISVRSPNKRSKGNGSDVDG
ncbi:hypothetical protein DFH28DRAFT_1099615 [Melampsora americana]|nr:hypothetical protein DFH28DRAFT_1099615 [Melampsora americana]